MATYTIIGNDQKQYGSVTEEQLGQWLAEGRVGAQTKVQAEGSAEWKSLSEIPAFAGLMKSSTPPPLPSAAPAANAKTNAMAVTSLVLGILGLFTCGLTALFGLICGIIAMVKVKNSGGKLSGSGLALAGTIVSGIFLFMLPIYAAMLLPALAVRIYSNGNTNHFFPPAATWCDAIKTFAGNEKVFKCAAANAASRCDYAFNAKLDGLDESKVDPQTVEIFESDAGWNASGGPELMVANARHGRGTRTVFLVAFVDGHVEAATSSRLNMLRWNP
jgi:hypothetical protein